LALYGIKPVTTKQSVHRYWWPSVNSATSPIDNKIGLQRKTNDNVECWKK